jgi:outer membrane immunogenic protein
MWLAGLETAYTFQDLDDSASTNLNGIPRTRRTEIGDMWSIAGRLGVVSGPWLGYGKIGYANAEIGFVNIRNSTGAVLGESHEREGGLLLGAGVEYAFTNNISLGLDYTFVNFNVDRHQQERGGVPVAAYNDDIDAQLHQVSLRLNYRFDQGRRTAPLK